MAVGGPLPESIEIESHINKVAKLQRVREVTEIQSYKEKLHTSPSRALRLERAGGGCFLKAEG